MQIRIVLSGFFAVSVLAANVFGQSPISVDKAVGPIKQDVDAANMAEKDSPANQAPAAADDDLDYRTTPSGLKIADLPGKPAVSAVGDYAIVHYTGKLQDGTKFDSSLDRGRPLTVVLGKGEVIKGWEEGLVGMKVGDKRQLIIPPDLAYGAEAKSDQNGKEIIPANSTLVFDVEMVGLVKTGQ